MGAGWRDTVDPHVDQVACGQIAALGCTVNGEVPVRATMGDTRSVRVLSAEADALLHNDPFSVTYETLSEFEGQFLPNGAQSLHPFADYRGIDVIRAPPSGCGTVPRAERKGVDLLKGHGAGDILQNVA